MISLPRWRNWQTCLPAGRRAGLKIMHTVYAIKSLAKNYIYVGLTNDIKRRFDQHNTGKEKTTSPYKPFKLIYTELSPDRKSARIIEKYWKSGVGKEKLKKL